MVEGKVSVADTYALEQVQVVGNYGKAALLGEIKKAEVKKAVAKTQQPFIIIRLSCRCYPLSDHTLWAQIVPPGMGSG